VSGASPKYDFESHGGYAAFLHRDFRLHALFRLLSTSAMQIQNVGVGWFLYSETKSAWALGLVGLAGFVPSMLFALVTGHVADNFNRRVIVAVAFLMCCACSVGLALIAAFGVQQTWLVYACLLLTGAGRAFGNPAANAITPLLVPRERFANAITWYSVSQQIATICGPALGGLLYVFGPQAVFCTSAAGFAAGSLCISMIRTPLGRGERAREPVNWSTLSAGLRYIRSRPELFGAISLDLAAVLFGGATALLPIVAQDVLHAGPEGLGLLRSSPAAGALAMAGLLAVFPLRSRVGLKMLGAVAVYGVSVIGFGLSVWMPLSMFFLALMGAANSISVVVRHTMVQIETPDAMRGRVAAVNSMFTGASNDLGDFESGATAAWLGAVPAIVLGGSATILCALLWGWTFPALRNRATVLHRAEADPAPAGAMPEPPPRGAPG
jgi:MFS family permease